LGKDKSLTKRASQELKKYMTNQELVSERKVAAAFLRGQKDKARAVAFESVADFERAGDVDGAASAIKTAQQQGFMSAEESVNRMQTVRSNVDWFKGLKIIDEDPEGFMAAADIDADSTIDLSFLPNLNPEQKLQLKARAQRATNARLQLGKEQRQIEVNEQQGTLMRLLRKGELTDATITGSTLDEFGTGSKDTFYKMLDKRNAASDPTIKAQVLEQIRDPESPIQPGDIAAKVGKGLSVEDADRFITRLDVYKGFWFKRADLYLKQNLGWSSTTSQFLHPEGSLTYGLAMDELFNAIEKGGLKGKPVYDIAKELAHPYIIDYYEKALMLDEAQMRRVRELLEGETESETKPKTKKKKPLKEVIDPKGIW
jgi:hypothetical protein